MSNIKSYFEMRKWVPESSFTQKESDTLISGLLKDLKGQAPGQNAISVGGDTLIFGSVEENGDVDIYECTIRRASANLVLEHPLEAQDGSVN